MTLLSHRYYAWVTARFLTRDPSGYGGGINLYAYCQNAPTVHADPTGFGDGVNWNNPGMTNGHPGMQSGTPQSGLANGMLGDLQGILINAIGAPIMGGIGEGLGGIIDVEGAAGEGAAGGLGDDSGAGVDTGGGPPVNTGAGNGGDPGAGGGGNSIYIIDENLPQKGLTNALGNLGINTTSVYQLGLQGVPDPTIIDTLNNLFGPTWTIITKNIGDFPPENAIGITGGNSTTIESILQQLGSIIGF